MRLLHRLFPFTSASATNLRDNLRSDLEAGIVGAILVLPQAIALATLAGMPPEYGIYTSIIPVIIAALWGSSSHTVSGPNTAICVLLMVSVAPLAEPGSKEYIQLVLGLTLIAGVLQLAVGLFSLGRVLNFISQSVIAGVVLAVAMIILVSSLDDLLALETLPASSFPERLAALLSGWQGPYRNDTIIGAISISAGLLAGRFAKRYALLIAMIVGTLASLVPSTFSNTGTGDITRLGELSLSVIKLSVPPILDHGAALLSLLPSAAAIAFLGLMQTVVISRSIGAKTGQSVDVDQEAVGQGLANITAPFISAFSGSGSFNRSAANLDSGARTRLASVIASVTLLVLVVAGARLLAWLPVAAVAAVLVLVGIGMIDIKSIRQLFRAPEELLVFLITLAFSLGLGLNAGVLAGVVSALAIYLWLASTPNVHLREGTARDGRPLITATIDGGLFFGAVHSVEQCIRCRYPKPDDGAILLIHTDHLTYLDVPGATMLARLGTQWQNAGGTFLVFINRDNILRAVERAGLTNTLGTDVLIFDSKPHPMKDILHPGSPAIPAGTDENTKTETPSECDMDALAKRLRTTRLFGALSPRQLETLLSASQSRFAPSGNILIDETDRLESHLLLTAGSLEAQKTWRTANGETKSHTWVLTPGTQKGAFVFLGASTHNVRVRAVTDVRYLEIDADRADEFISWTQHIGSETEQDPELKQRMELVSHLSAFSRLPLSNVLAAIQAFTRRPVEAGEKIVVEGEKGDAYFVIEDGQANVIRTDPFTDETAVVATLSPGDAFGEEALLQDAFRNATVEMITPGSLLVMQKTDFDKLIEPEMAEEIDAESAHALIESGKVRLIDCRYDMEFEESRIPGATHIALDRLRWDIHNVDPDADYIVYCRSGRRSMAAAFLLSERNIRAQSLNGGIKNWPFDIDSSPLTT